MRLTNLDHFVHTDASSKTSEPKGAYDTAKQQMTENVTQMVN